MRIPPLPAFPSAADELRILERMWNERTEALRDTAAKASELRLGIAGVNVDRGFIEWLEQRVEEIAGEVDVLARALDRARDARPRRLSYDDNAIVARCAAGVHVMTFGAATCECGERR